MFVDVDNGRKWFNRRDVRRLTMKYTITGYRLIHTARGLSYGDRYMGGKVISVEGYDDRAYLVLLQYSTKQTKIVVYGI